MNLLHVYRFQENPLIRKKTSLQLDKSHIRKIIKG